MTAKVHAILSFMVSILAVVLVWWVVYCWTHRSIAGSADYGYRWPITMAVFVVLLGALCLYQQQRTRVAMARTTGLREREQLFRTLFEQSCDANLLLDHERFFDCNAATVRLMRAASKEQVLNRQPADLSPEFQPDGRRSTEKAQAIITAAFQEGSQRFEWVHRRLDGSEVWVEVLLTVIPWRNQHILHTTWRDITQRKSAEEALRASEARFRDLSTLASDWFWEQDDQFRFIYFTLGKAMADLERIGINPNRFLGKTRWEIPIVNLTPEQWVGHRALLDAHQPFRDFEYRVHSDSGEERWFSINGLPLFDAAGCFTGYRGTGRDITEQQRDKQHIQYLAYYDALTGLPNRTLLTQRANLMLGLAERHGEELAILFLDLDRFKEVNDSLGHTEGDALLVEVARRLERTIRETDTVCRLGGDEFVLLLPDVGLEGARRVADKLLAAFRQPFNIASHRLHATLSAGIALYPHNGVNFDELLKNADTALYRAKEAGRNTRMFYAREMNIASVARLMLETELRQALETGQLRAYYQPKLRLADGKLVGAEVLVRWQHPKRGLIPPNQFIPLAEASDLIVGLGDWMLEEVSRQLATWRSTGLPALHVAVNLAARHFRQPGFVAYIEGLLTIYGLPPAALELELTESTLLETGAQTTDTLQGLRRLGIGLAVDDFGTGYSSLGYLKRLPITALKIDQSFVRDLENDPDDRTLAATIVALGHSLGLKVIAEGVETEQQRRILLEQGCDLAQGYLFSQPLPAEDFVTWLTRQSSIAASLHCEYAVVSD
ncbi:MAG: EAL domain-containing protein [Candidatus Competibacteraceae bacterium]|nr:EAL domain-containing protein [Candidatus Competibacteraceae bacterium]